MLSKTGNFTNYPKTSDLLDTARFRSRVVAVPAALFLRIGSAGLFPTPPSHRGGNMKSKTLMCITALALFQSLAAQTWVYAQEQAELASTFKMLHAFTGLSDGGNPMASLIRDTAGNLYGTTNAGGTVACRCGIVFKLDTTGKEGVLHKFTGADGANPQAGLVRDAAGNLYGTTVFGGHCNFCGVVFKLDTTGKETVLHRFTFGADGANPQAGLVRDAAGNLYGTAGSGGIDGPIGACASEGCGVAFKLDTTGKETVLHSFTGKADGGHPITSLVRDNAGNLYSTTYAGGIADGRCNFTCGIVFKLDTTGKETVLHRFTGGADGKNSSAGLVRDAAGNLYGTTRFGGNLTCGGGSVGCGVVFKLDTTGKETVLHKFTGGTDGAFPNSVLVRDAVGNLYGTTMSGGDPLCQCGVVFKLDTNGKETVLHKFTGGTDGAAPQAGLLRDGAGNLYGTAFSAGSNASACGGVGCGIVFKLTP